MKVMCIIEKDNWATPSKVVKSFLFGLYKKTLTSLNKSNGPAYGETCTVTGTHKADEVLFYTLKEYTLSNSTNLYQASCFIPLSEISETEFKRDYNKQTA